MAFQAAALKQQIEAQLARRIPAALSPIMRPEAVRQPLADPQLTALLQGGIPVGAITEVHGAACSGRTSLALSLAAAVTAAGSVAAWVDANDAFDPEAAALCGVDLDRLLWVRCGADETKGKGSPRGKTNPAAHRGASALSSAAQASPGLVAANHTPKPVGNGGCGSPHPRGEGRGMGEAIDALLHEQPSAAAMPSRRARKIVGTPGAPNRDVARAHMAAMPFPNASPYREEQVPTDRQPSRRAARQEATAAEPAPQPRALARGLNAPAAAQRDVHAEGSRKDDWGALDQALRAVDLLLQAGGFGLLVLDLGDIPATIAWRIPLATWFRFRAGCERSRAILLVVSQHPCARASADLTIAATYGGLQSVGGTVAVGSEIRLHVEQQRRGAEAAAKVVPLRKPVRSDGGGVWTAASPWGVRA